MPISLQDRVIVIAGASAGIGRATALACAQAGMHVVVSARRMDKLEALAAEIRALGRQCVPVVCDVTQKEQVQSLIDQSVQEFGRLDVVFANAGYGLFASVLDTTEQEFRDIFETNFYGTLHVLQAAGRVMLQQERQGKAGRGHLLVCTSAASEVSPPMYAAYGATKAAQDSLAQSMRAELFDEGIWVTSVHPIPTTTDFFAVLKEHSGAERQPQSHRMPYSQTAQQVAAAIVRGLRRPCPEIWPHKLTRFGVGLAAMWPSLPHWALVKHMRAMRKQTSE